MTVAQGLDWHHAGGVLDCSRGRLVGIVNANPDSFSDEGAHAGTERAVRHGLRLAEQGADVVEVGGESLRFSAPSPVEVEIGRVAPVIEALVEERLDDLPTLLADRLHEPHRAAGVPGLEAMRALAGGGDCLGATISGSGPSILLWCRADATARVEAAATAALEAEGVAARVRPSRPSSAGVRARWTGGSDLRLARAVG